MQTNGDALAVSAAKRPPAVTYKSLYSFKGVPDGATPYAGGLIDVNGTLYGTTRLGGATGIGTVFKVSTSDGTESVLYSFHGTQGAFPSAALIDVNGALYGTTFGGGATGAGTVFEVSTRGKERVLHSFSGTDGAGPSAALIDVNGALYGTAYGGGASGGGTVFEVSTSGNESVLYSFKGDPSDGQNPPGGGLIDVNGTLYGTTEAGGGSASCFSGCGTVFKVSL